MSPRLFVNNVILTCPPADAAKRRELGIVAFAPGADMTQGGCEKCGAKILISKIILDLKAGNPEARIFCFACALATDKARLAGELGGRGGHYLLNPKLIKKPRKS